MSLVTASVYINAPPERVWEMVMDPRQLGDWVTIHRRLVHADSGPARIGFGMEQQLHLRGVNVDVHWRLVDCRPCELAIWEGRGRRARAHGSSTCSLLRMEGRVLTTATSSIRRSV